MEAAWNRARLKPDFTWLRQPEFGAVRVRGRTGGTGQKFNLGETVATRCALRLACGTAGYAYILGRSVRHAELAALCDTTQSAIARLESGGRPPRIDTLLRIASALECELHVELRPAERDG